MLQLLPHPDLLAAEENARRRRGEIRSRVNVAAAAIFVAVDPETTA